MPFRNTLARDLTISGTALHAGRGRDHDLVARAGGAGRGVPAQRQGGAEIPARYDLVGETRLGTVIEKDGVSVGVIEHLMAAVAGAGMDDLTVTLDGPEPPILDGDALSYLTLIEEAGLKDQQNAAPARIKVLQPVRVDAEGRLCQRSIRPRPRPMNSRSNIPTPAIGRQNFHLALFAGEFPRRDRARPHLRLPQGTGRPAAG